MMRPPSLASACTGNPAAARARPPPPAPAAAARRRAASAAATRAASGDANSSSSSQHRRRSPSPLRGGAAPASSSSSANNSNNSNSSSVAASALGRGNGSGDAPLPQPSPPSPGLLLGARPPAARAAPAAAVASMAGSLASASAGGGAVTSPSSPAVVLSPPPSYAPPPPPPPMPQQQQQQHQFLGGGEANGAAPSSLLPPSTKVHHLSGGSSNGVAASPSLLLDAASLGPTAVVADAAETRLPAPPPPPPRPDTGARRGARPNRVARAAARLSQQRAQRLSPRELDALLRAAFAPAPRSAAAPPPPPPQQQRRRSGGGGGNRTAAGEANGDGPLAPVMTTLPSAELDGVASAQAPDLARRFAELARAGEFHAAVQLLQACQGAGREDALSRLSHRAFLRAARSARAPREALAFLRALPEEHARDPRTYTLALSVCAAAASPGAAQAVQDLMAARGVPLDLVHSTALIGVATATAGGGALASGSSSAAGVQQAFRHYAEAKAAAQQEALRLKEAKKAANQAQEEARRGGKAAAGGEGAAPAAASSSSSSSEPARLPPARLDSTAYGALIHACAVAVREAEAQADRKTQLVLLERALGVVDEALNAGATLDAPAWNALLLCAGRAGQLQRAFEVLDRMTAAGVAPTSATYCGLMEACVLARRPALALRVFRRALAAPSPLGSGRNGSSSRQDASAPARSVQIYTAAVNACIRLGRAQDRAIAAARQRERGGHAVGGSVGLGALPPSSSSSANGGASTSSSTPSDETAAFAGSGSGFGSAGGRRAGQRQHQQHQPQQQQGEEAGWGKGLDALLAAAGALADGGGDAASGAFGDDDDERGAGSGTDADDGGSSTLRAPAGGSATAFEAALDVYAAAQRNGVEPDDLLCGNLVALAGRAGRMDAVAALVDDQRAAQAGPLGPAAASALVHALLASGDAAGAVKAYEAARAAGVPLHAAQYNALMELYARGLGVGGSEEEEDDDAVAFDEEDDDGGGLERHSSTAPPVPASRLGDVIGVVEDMLAARVEPTPNTYRVLLAACQRAGCSELAFEVHQCAKRRGVVLRDRVAQSAAYSLLKACLNRIRAGWERGSGWRPAPAAAAAAGPGAAAALAAARGAGQPGSGSGTSAAALASASLRPAQARALLAALESAGAATGGAAWGSSGSGSGGSSGGASASSSSSHHHAHSPRDASGVRRHAFLDYSDNINWPQLAVATYRDFVAQGLRPAPHVIDAALACLRQRYRPPAVPAALLLQQQAAQQGADAAASNGCEKTAEILRDLRREANATSANAMGGDRPYEYALDRRAMDLVGEAVAAGWLPSFRTDAPFTADFRQAPPTLTEAYVLWVLNSLVSAASSASASSSAAGAGAGAAGGAAGGAAASGGPSADAAAAVAAAMGGAAAGGAADGAANGDAGSAADASSSASSAAARRVARYPVRFIVPKYDANYVNWPSWLPKETLHYDEDGCSGGAVARRRAAAAFSAATSSRGGGGASGSIEDTHEDEHEGGEGSRSGRKARGGGKKGSGSGRGRRAQLGAGGNATGMGAAGYYHVIGASSSAAADAASGAGGSSASSSAASGSSGLVDAGLGAQTGTAGGGYVAREATALATAATMRRLKVFALADPSSGVLTLPADELNRWVFARAAYEAAQRARATADGYGDVYTGPWEASASSLGGGGAGGGGAAAAAAAARRRAGAAGAAGAGAAAAGSPAALLAQQQRNIRLGISLGAPPPSAFQQQMQRQQQLAAAMQQQQQQGQGQ